MMNQTFNLRCTEDGISIPCIGRIEVLRFEPPVFYASWNVSHVDGVSIASKSRSYFVGEQMPDEKTAINLVKENIRKYRLGREHPFNDIE